MATENELNQIVDYAFEADNLELALKIGLAFDKIRRRVMVDFMIRLAETLKDISVESAVVSCELINDRNAKDLGVYFSRESWGDKLYIGIYVDGGGAYLGVWKGDKYSEVEYPGLKQKLDGIIPGKSFHGTLLWYKYFDNFRDWNSDEVLSSLHRSDEPFNYIYGVIEKFILEATPIINMEIHV